MFHVGQKVIFVGFPRYRWRALIRELVFPIPGPFPTKGEVYTIAKISADDGDMYLSLFELRETINEHWSEGWDATGFRPVVERKTDISIFTKLLTPTKRETTDA